MRKFKFLVAVLVLVLGVATAFALTGGGLAGIGTSTIEQTGPCTNGGGHTPPGQQDNCNGGGLTEPVTTTFVATNPAGHEPPGKQP